MMKISLVDRITKEVVPNRVHEDMRIWKLTKRRESNGRLYVETRKAYENEKKYQKEDREE